MLRLAFAAAAACLIACACAQPDVGPKSGANPWTPEDWEVAHCGKRFRIATHEAPPFTIVDKTRCAVGSQLCPAAAWWEQGGGLTYKFVEQHLKPILIQSCKDKKMANVDVAFDWYLASDDTAGASNPVRMVCNGDFINHRKPSNSNCTANYEYKGPSPFGACKSRDDPTCVSKGPDLVAGAVHILRERVDLLDFTGPYVTVRQVTVKVKKSALPNIMATFQCFDESLWFLGLFFEVAIVWGLILLVETWVNPGIDKSNPITPFYDSLYWSFGSALDPGGPGKAPFTVGGRLFMIGHWFYLTIMVATYTGVLGPFLVSSAEVVVTGLPSLKSGAFNVVVRGPAWDHNAATPAYLGTHVPGGDGTVNTSRSTQFKILQNIMKADSTVKFKIQTVQTQESTIMIDGLPEPFKYSKKMDPCDPSLKVNKGAWDLLECGGSNKSTSPHALIFDAPSAYYELRKRRTVRGKCTMYTVGDQFFVSGFGMGFPKNNLYSRAFNSAIQKAIDNGTISELEKEYNTSSDDFPCEESSQGGTDEIVVTMVTGVIIFSVLFLLIGTIQALVGGLPSGRTGRVLAAIMTCKVQPEPDDGGEEEEAEEEAEEQNAESKKSSRVTSRAPSEAGDLPGPSIRVAKLCGRTQRMEEYLERLRLTVPR